MKQFRKDFIEKKMGLDTCKNYFPIKVLESQKKGIFAGPQIKDVLKEEVFELN